MHKFVQELSKLIKDDKIDNYKIYHYTSQDYAKQANACFLMGAFCIIALGMDPETTWDLFEDYKGGFKPFRDATMGVCTYKCTILDCLQGLSYAIKLGWYDFDKFDCEEYEFYE